MLYILTVASGIAASASKYALPLILRKPDTPSTITLTDTPLSAASISAPNISFPLSSDLKSKVESIISSFAWLIILIRSFNASLLSSIILALSGLVWRFKRSVLSNSCFSPSVASAAFVAYKCNRNYSYYHSKNKPITDNITY